MSASLESLMLSQLDSVPPVSLARELLSFVLIGGAAALAFVGISTLAVSLLPSLPAWLVSSLCYAGFIGPVYLLHRRFSFHAVTAHRRALPRYAMVQFAGVAFAALFSFIAYGVIAMPSAIAALLVIGLTSGVNFVVLRLWAFNG